MDILDEILKTYELNSKKNNEDIFSNILEELSKKLGILIVYKNQFLSTRLFFQLKYNYIYDSNYIEWFFNILSEYSYNMKNEIKDVMFSLGHLNDSNKNKEVIVKLLTSPIIQDISYDGKGTYTIYSENYGKFIFTLASHYYKENNIMHEYIKNEKLPHRCHEHAYFLSKLFGDLYAVTSICPAYFNETYYHSYTFDVSENIIIDLCYNAIIDKDLYYQIFNPEEISVILNRKVNEEIKIIKNKTIQPTDRCQLLKIALYKQYLESINYKGSLEEAPTLKKKIF